MPLSFIKVFYWSTPLTDYIVALYVHDHSKTALLFISLLLDDLWTYVFFVFLLSTLHLLYIMLFNCN